MGYFSTPATASEQISELPNADTPIFGVSFLSQDERKIAMKKRIFSMFLALVMLLGQLPATISAASSLEDAMKEVSIFARYNELDWLTMNGSVKKQRYIYYKLFVIFHLNLMYLGKWRQSLYFQVFPPFALRESSSHKLVFPGVSLR